MFRPTDSLYQSKTGRVATPSVAAGTYLYFAKYSPESNAAWLRDFLSAVQSWNAALPEPFDYYGLMGQFSQESDYARSTYLLRDGNPVGIGISASGMPSPWSGKLSPNMAALVWLLELIVHVTPGLTTMDALLATLPPEFQDAYTTDKSHITRVVNLRKSVYWPEVRTWNDLRTPVGIDDYVWAADQAYGSGIANRANEAFPGLPDAKGAGDMSGNVIVDKNGTVLNMTKGLIPWNGYANRILSTSVNTAFDYLGQRRAYGFVLHRMLGSLWGTDSYFRGEGATLGRTDYGSSSITGETLMWTDPLGNVSGWASGRYNGAYGDGKAFEEKYGPISGLGANVINCWQVSWEIDGFYDDPWSDASMDKAANACAHYAHDYGIPWDVWPIAPQDGFSFVRWHQEFTLGTGKVCPGNVVMAQTPAFIEKVRAILLKYQTGGNVVSIPTGPKAPDGSAYPEGLDDGMMSFFFGRVVHGSTVHEFSPIGTISTAWYKRSKAKGMYPRLVDTFTDRSSGRSYFFFADGSIIWRPNNKVKYRWVNAA